MSGKAKILVLRFSAMGDVAMIAPVLKEFRANYPHTELVIVSRSLFKPFFEGISDLTFHTIDPKGKHKGFLGLIRLFRELKTLNITSVADLHNNLRSKILTTLFTISGVRSATLDKGRTEKKRLTRKKDKQLIPLTPTVQRYANVFTRLGHPFTLQNTLHKSPAEQLNNTELRGWFNELLTTRQETGEKWIGVSPFAQHPQKVYPPHKLEEVILALAAREHRIFIFGGSEEEQQTAETWAKKHPNISSLVRKMKLTEELKFISNLDVMLSMDSSGMHLASLKNIPVVSVWGATHPYAGFLGYGQSISNAVQIDLSCRPCSVYGNIPCYRGDFACMNNLPPQTVINSVLNTLKHE